MAIAGGCVESGASRRRRDLVSPARTPERSVASQSGLLSRCCAVLLAVLWHPSPPPATINAARSRPHRWPATDHQSAEVRPFLHESRETRARDGPETIRWHHGGCPGVSCAVTTVTNPDEQSA